MHVDTSKYLTDTSKIPPVKFPYVAFLINGVDAREQSRQEYKEIRMIPLEHSGGTLYHLQRYASKGWRVVAYANLTNEKGEPLSESFREIKTWCDQILNTRAQVEAELKGLDAKIAKAKEAKGRASDEQG